MIRQVEAAFGDGNFGDRLFSACAFELLVLREDFRFVAAVVVVRELQED